VRVGGNSQESWWELKKGGAVAGNMKAPPSRKASQSQRTYLTPSRQAKESLPCIGSILARQIQMRHTDTYRHRQYKTHSLAASADGLVVCGKKKKKDGRGRGGFHGSTAFPRRPRWNDGRWARQSWPLMLHEPWAACALDAFPCDTPRSCQRPITTRSSRSWLGVHCVGVGESPGSCSSSKQEPAERNEFPSISGLQSTYSVQSILSVSQDTHRGREYPDTQTYPDTPRYSYQSSQSSLRRRAPLLNAPPALLCTASHCSPRASYGTHIALL
jgi:hypothetical protein